MALLRIDNNDYFILILSNETNVLAAETIVKKQGYDAKIISIPRRVSSGCGMALRLKLADKTNILELLKNNSISFIKLLNMEEL